MNAKPYIWVGVIIGSTVGGFIADLWGASILSFSSIILSAIGGLIGLWFGFKLSDF